jgi:adenosyl cobinamide kinase/adenosyl cobinamide phosphate guanylyltransferase
LITLVLGGTRSGKSQVAEDLVAGRQATLGGQVTYVATGRASDDDMAARIAAHRARRPATWATVETGAGGGAGGGPDLPALLAGLTGHVLVDSLGTWVAADGELSPDVPALCAALGTRARDGGGDTVLVSEEVGLGVHPATEVGRRFADALGELNRAVADVADRVLLVVAGRVLPLDRVSGPG